MPTSHTSRDFESELRDLRAQSLAMGARCERALELALDAYWTGSKALAAEVLEIDRRIDKDEMAIDALVLRILALRQPVAYDLRVLTTALKLVTDLERIGDEAVNISERAEAATPRAKACAHEDIKGMAEDAQKMLRDALDAFVNGDADRADRVLLKDDDVDAAYGRTLALMTEFMSEHPDEIPSAIAVVKVAKYIERIADHATNIAEEVIFMVRGEDVRHLRTHPPPAVV
ncbi:MAG: phosphate signaling complex protein PhoU [Polyangiaceae bacterium]